MILNNLQEWQWYGVINRRVSFKNFFINLSGLSWPTDETSGDVLRAYVNGSLNSAYDGDVTGAAITPTSGVSFPRARTYNGTATYTDIYSTELNSFFNPTQGTLIAFAKSIYDGTTRYITRLAINNDNQIYFSLTGTNQVTVLYEGQNVAKSIDLSVDMSTWAMIAITWEFPGNLVAYANGVFDSQLSIPSVMVGNLSVSGCFIASFSALPSGVWSGDIGPVLLSQDVLTPAQILQIAQKAGVV